MNKTAGLTFAAAAGGSVDEIRQRAREDDGLSQPERVIRGR